MVNLQISASNNDIKKLNFSVFLDSELCSVLSETLVQTICMSINFYVYLIYIIN